MRLAGWPLKTLQIRLARQSQEQTDEDSCEDGCLSCGYAWTWQKAMGRCRSGSLSWTPPCLVSGYTHIMASRPPPLKSASDLSKADGWVSRRPSHFLVCSVTSGKLLSWGLVPSFTRWSYAWPPASQESACPMKQRVKRLPTVEFYTDVRSYLSPERWTL